MKRKPAKSDIRNFEVSLEKLKTIVGQLENGKLTLSEALQRYEEGIKHLTECHEMLNLAQMKIEQLVKLDEQGRLITKSFDDTASFDPADRGESSAKSNRRSSSDRYSKPSDSVKTEAKSPRRPLASAVPESQDFDQDLEDDDDWEEDDLEESGEPEEDAESDHDSRQRGRGRGSRSDDPSNQKQSGFLDFEEDD